MSRKNISSIVFLLIIIIAVSAYFIYPKLVKTDADPWLMIPDNSALIFQFDKPSSFVDKLEDDNEVLQSALKSPEFKKVEIQLNWLKDLLKENESYFDLLANSSLFVSIHPNEIKKTTSRLLLSQIETNLGIDKIRSLLGEKLGNKYAIAEISERNFAGIKIIDAVNEQTFYMTFKDGILLASSDLNLITKSLETYNSTQSNFSKTSDFSQVQKTAGKKVDAKIYINYKNFSELLKLHSSVENTEVLEWFSEFASWTEVDLIVKKDEILMTGFTSFKNKEFSFLNRINAQLPKKSLILNVCPFNTDILLRFGFSDYYSHYLSSHDEAKVPSLNYDLSQFLKLIGNEIAFGCNANQISEFEDKSFAIINVKDRARAEKLLGELAKITKGKRRSKINGYSINQIKNKEFLSSLFGNAFKSINKNYYLFMGDNIVFANSKEMLGNIIQMYDTGKTLDLNDNFKAFSDNLSSTDNISLFIKPKDIFYLFPKFMEPETSKVILGNKELINDLQGLSFQFSNDGKMAYTNFYLKLGTTFSEENLALWKIELDNEIVGKPSLVRNHATNKFMVLVFDKSSNLYLIDTDGQLLWKKRVDGLPQGEIHQVDYFKNGKIQYLFNTRDFIYLIDKNGNFVKNYPKKLNPASTNGLNVFDYNRKKDYRLMLAQADKKIYNYNINGSKVKGWKEPHTHNIVNESVKRVVANNKDFILITDIDNKTKIVNRKGKERINIKGSVNKARNSSFYVNRTNSKGIILTTNQKGKLTYIKSNGRLDQTDFGAFTKDHFFLYEDFNDDNSVDFIFVDGRKMQVFDRYKKELFSYHFENEINIKPMFFSLGHKQSVLGVVSSQEKTIYLFDSKGNTIISRGLVGETPFTVGSLKNNRELNLVTAAGSMLYNYRLK
jgi:hypothetical protein